MKGAGLPPAWNEVAEPRFRRVAAFGGVYSNHLALQRALEEAAVRDVDAIVCLGDLGAFGPNPDRSCEILRNSDAAVIRGNYDDSLARGLEDCQCGYTDPKDNHYARISYRYTFEHTSAHHRRWMGGLPESLRFRVGDARVLAFHGSPRRMNEFLWESTTPTHFLDRMAREYGADVLLGTHTGLHWSRSLPSGGGYVNAGSLGRPANNGDPAVWLVVLDVDDGGEVRHEFVRVSYDHESLAVEMEKEGLPSEFVDTIRTGWWTTCLEVLPGKERARGRW